MNRPIPSTYHRAIAGLRRLAAVTAPAVIALAGSAVAATPQRTLIIRGAGDGHGIGMSQWGAYGYARHGADYRTILAHYYTGTTVGKTAAGHIVSVLLAGNRSSISITGANRVGGRGVAASRIYKVTLGPPGELVLRSTSGGRPLTLAAPLRATGPGLLTVLGTAENGVSNGAYRGALELRPGRQGGVNVVDALHLEDYVREVIGVEVSPDWPAAALRAQAVATRTYALAAPIPGANGFDVYSDTRSQVFGGAGAEHASTDQAVRDTLDQVVTYAGHLAVTYFFASSGGQTESVQSGFPGATPEPWLKSVSDPYDSFAPDHTWGPLRMTFTDAAARLGSLVHGTLQSIDVIRRGDSPRIVSADVVGSGGRTRVTGVALAGRLGLVSTWAFFSFADANGAEHPMPDSSGTSGTSAPAAPAGVSAPAGSGGGAAAP
jgi:stage II sporulation protein D